MQGEPALEVAEEGSSVEVGGGAMVAGSTLEGGGPMNKNNNAGVSRMN